MTTTRAAKYLAAVDLGKTIQLLDRYTGAWETGTFTGIESTHHPDAYILVTITGFHGPATYDLHPDDEVTLTGQPSPPTSNPHGVSFRGEPELAAIRPTFHGEDQAQQPLPAPIPAAQAADATDEHSHAYALGKHECLACGEPPTDPEPRPRGYEENQK